MIDAMIDPKIWAYLVKAVGTVMTDIHLKFGPDGLKVIQVTSDKSTMVGAIIPKADFIEYNATGEHLIIMNMEQISQIAKRLGKTKTAGVGLSYDEDGPDNNLFQMVLTGEDNRRVFNIIMMAPDPEYKNPTDPFDIEVEMGFDSEFQMTGTGFESIIKDLMIMAVRAKFLVEQKRVVFKGGTSEGSEAKIVYDIGKELSSLSKSTDEEPLSAMFTLAVLERLTTAIMDKSQNITIKMSHNKPLWFELPIGQDENSTSRLVMLQAPVVERRS